MNRINTYKIKLLSSFIICSIMSVILFSSCDNFENNQQTPAYIKVSGFKVVMNPNISYQQDDGFLTNNITDVWLYVDNEFLGVYSLPTDTNKPLVIPILKEGKHVIQLRPGVKWNGMAATREYYRFYTYENDTVDLVSGQTITIPTQNITYNNYATFAMVDLFEDTYNHFQDDTTSKKRRKITSNNLHIISNDSVKYGHSCGAMYMNSESSSFKILSKDSISCSNQNAMILELDYHCNIPFEVGVYGRTSSSSSQRSFISSVRLKSNVNNGWQKIYIILGKSWGLMNYLPFQLYFQPFNPDKISNGFVHIDNIKIVHYPE